MSSEMAVHATCDGCQELQKDRGHLHSWKVSRKGLHAMPAAIARAAARRQIFSLNVASSSDKHEVSSIQQSELGSDRSTETYFGCQVLDRDAMTELWVDKDDVYHWYLPHTDELPAPISRAKKLEVPQT